MDVLLLASGSRGYVQPLIALARALENAGHRTVFHAPATYEKLAEDHGVYISPFEDELAASRMDASLWKALEGNIRGLRSRLLFQRFKRKRKLQLSRCLEQIVAAVDNSDADVVVNAAYPPVQDVVAKCGKPVVAVRLQPRPDPQSSENGYGSQLLKDAYYMAEPKEQPATILQACSRYLHPDLLDESDGVHTTGYWFLSTTPDWAPSPELSKFLSTGDPPVYIGFGSLLGTDPNRVGHIVAEAVQRVDVRAVVVAGLGGIKANCWEDNVLYLNDVPFDWLFPRTRAVVHHGGAGTTGAALAACRPQVVCPLNRDQWFNAECVHAAGVSPAPQPHRKLTAEGLANAISRAITDKPMMAHADEIGRRVREEPGPVAAVEILESFA